MSAQQNYNEAWNKVQCYFNLGLMNSEDIATFDEAKRLGSVGWNVGAGFPAEDTKIMKNLSQILRQDNRQQLI